MAHPFLPLMIGSIIASAHGVDLNAHSRDPISLAKKANPSLILIARRDSPADGDDPHGDDPHDENRQQPFDKKMPARDHRDDAKAPKDPYGGEYPQGRAPY
jgi:hypothetical protein